jgi:SAM-dependent methyltransferase
MGFSKPRPLGDAPDRSYVAKLEQFALFAEPELRRVFADLTLTPDTVALDLGCGAGLATAWLNERIGARGYVAGVDLSLPHLRAARARHATLVQGDADRLCFRAAVFDFIWSCNTVNHVRDPVALLKNLRPALRSGGRVALAQSGFLPEMFFAWDAPLEDAVRRACHRYYRDRYGLQVQDTARLRGLVRQLREAGFSAVQSRTYVLERTQPLRVVDREYLQQAIFEGAWGEKIHTFLDARQRARLQRNCDPGSPEYCLDREDFHHIQTLTVCEGRA